MSALVLIGAILGGGYALLVLAYRVGWSLQQQPQVPEGFEPLTPLSVIIPARNEAANIGACLQSLLSQHYPPHLLEVIVVDDFSEDDTAAVVRAQERNNVKLVQLQDIVADRSQITAFKKMALAAGIAASKGSLIVTTDADCMAGPEWLRSIAAVFEQTGAQAIIGPVDFITDAALVTRFQSLDFMTMQGITAASRRLKLGHMANGANFAFSREAYEAVQGYEGTTHIASGDDYLLLVKLAAQFPDRIAYLKSREAIVRTAPQPTWRALLNQRIRWASKSGKYKDHRLTTILMLVYLFNLSLLALAVGSCWSAACLKALSSLLILKVGVELLLLWPVADFFGKRKELLLFPLLQPLHIMYICLAGFFGYLGKYEWKGRRLS